MLVVICGPYKELLACFSALALQLFLQGHIEHCKKVNKDYGFVCIVMQAKTRSARPTDDDDNDDRKFLAKSCQLVNWLSLGQSS